MPDIKVKGYSGNEFEYENVEKVWLTSAKESTKETLLTEQELEFTVADEDETRVVYATGLSTVPDIAAEATVTISWDGTEYTCKAVLLGDGFIVVGNLYILNAGEDSGEPFALLLVLEISDPVAEIGTLSTDPTHTVAIYKGSTGSALVPFTYGELLDGVEITPDFSTGDQQISVPDGSLVKEATILKPDTLIPENIVKGVKIAGVAGNYVPDTEEVAVELDMSEGDQTIEPSEGKLLSKATVKKPETLVPENILLGVEIGGVVGSAVAEVETEEKTVELDFSSGDMTIEPTEGKFLSRVDIPKPETLVPENIAKDVMIAGILGTHEGEGGGGGGGGGSTTGDYLVKVIDYDGTVLARSYLNEGDTFTLPDAPSHERLVFEQWVSPAEIVDNTVTVGNSPITIGATYHTASGATEIDITLTAGTGLSISFRSYLTGKSSIDWGDGTVDNNLSHTYTDYGDYTIKIYGMTAIANGSSGNTGGGILMINSKVTAIYIASGVTSIGNYAFDKFYSLSYITFPNTVTSFGTYVFEYCYALRLFISPAKLTEVSTRCFFNCSSLSETVFNYTLKYISSYAFYICPGLSSIVFPQNLGSIYSYAFAECAGIHSIWVTGRELATIDTYAFNKCYSLSSVYIKSSYQISIGNYAFQHCTGLARCVIRNSVRTIGSYAFSGNYSLRILDLTSCKSIPTLSSANGIPVNNDSLQILVPASLYDTWIAATNWSARAKYIVAV